MGFAERQSLADQVIGHIGGLGVTALGCLAQALGVQRGGGRHGGRRLQADIQFVTGGEHIQLVFLKVFVVGERQPLEQSAQGGQATHESRRLAPYELGCIRVSFLRHDARSAAPGIWEPQKAELQ